MRQDAFHQEDVCTAAGGLILTGNATVHNDQLARRSGLSMVLLNSYKYGAKLSPTESVLHKHIDKASSPWIRDVGRVVKELHNSYDPRWTSKAAAVDQGYIFVLCENELHHNASSLTRELSNAPTRGLSKDGTISRRWPVDPPNIRIWYGL